MMLSMLAALSLATLAPKSPSLEASFTNPPAWAKPHTWWHWMAGNVTKEGITADLEAMKFAGIGGAHIFDAGQGIPEGPVAYNSPQWRELMAHAMREATRLGLDMTMHNCSGWSSSGGPWVKPEDSMKRLVWSVAQINGTKGITATTAPVPESAGDWYRDIAVYVFPTPSGTPWGPNALLSLTGMGGNPGPNPEFEWPKIPATKPLLVAAPGGGAWSFGGKSDARDENRSYTVLRLGYTLTRVHNVASRPSGEGLEVDKFSAQSLDRFLAGGLEPLFKVIGDPVGKAFKTVLIDSYETWFQNWTPNMVADFKRLRGYDPTPYLPALTGFAVKDDETTRRFLFDYRRTLTDLWAENYSGHFAKRLKEHGLQLAVEPYGNGDFDPFTYGKPASLIMGEYWVGEAQINGSVKQAASVAHVYGRKVVGAESLTAAPYMAGWSNHPKQWKPFADRGYINGVNRIIYHRFAHQPWVSGVLPGMTMGPWGSHVDRTQTFWSYMPSWDRYLSRCQYMLQSGVYVADVCLFTGEGGPQEYTGEGYDLPEVPNGYNFDYCGLDPLMSLKVKNGRLVLPNGASYAVLALPNTDRMSVKLAAKIRSLLDAGAVVVGPKPKRSPQLAEMGSGDAKVAAFGKAYWSDGERGIQRTGEGTVYWGTPVAEVLRALRIAPDFKAGSQKLTNIHRKIGKTDVYFVASPIDWPIQSTCEFRVTGMVPELWNAQTGEIVDASVWRETATGVSVDIPFESNGSTFVVFRRPSRGVNHLVSLTSTPRDAGEAPAKKLEIVRAEYGQLGVDGKSVDVTTILSRATEGNALRISATNEEMGGDPAPQVVKALKVTYRFGGEEQTQTVPEGGFLVVGDFPSATSLPSCTVRPLIGGLTMQVFADSGFNLKWASVGVSSIDVSLPKTIDVEGPWEVRFPKGWDAPEVATFDKLVSWTDRPEFGIKYFSGTAIYRKRVEVPAGYTGKGMRLYLDLGDVRECCRVKVNGKPAGEFWKPPYAVDVTSLIPGSEADIEVEVTNLWVNRLIGDEQFPDDMGWDGEQLKGWPEWFVKGLPRPEPRRKTFTTWRRNTKDTPLLPSGLLGPVKLRPVQVIQVQAPKIK